MVDIQKFKLQYITNSTAKYNHLRGTQIVLEAGCRWVQLRIKSENKNEIIELANQIQELCKKYDATFIIDDYVYIAKEVSADGVHLGKTDMPINEARRILGDDMIIGGTANTFEDIVELKRNGVNYIGLGPYKYTTTKQNLSSIIGLNGYKEIFNKLIMNDIFIPVVAIGGIKLEDVSDLIKVGANGIAISGAILNSDEPLTYTKKIIQEINIV